ncbi:hypothetical protein ADUPG1_002552, partial [Aduncisulcus paluster]
MLLTAASAAIVFLLADGFGLDGLGVAVCGYFEISHAGACFGKVRLGLSQICLIHCRVNMEKGLSFFYVASFRKVTAEDDSCYPGTYLCHPA